MANLQTMKNIWTGPSMQVELRDIGSPIDWKPFDSYEVNDGRFVIREAKDNDHDLSGAAEAFRTGFPVILGTELEILFKPHGFHLLLGEKEQFNKGDFFMFVAEEVATGKIAGAKIIRMLKCQRNGEFVAVAVNEHFHQLGIGRELCVAGDTFFEACGIEMAFVFLATEHTLTQRFCIEEGGFHVIGIFHGYYRVWSGKDNLARRANCVLAQKFYNGAEKMCPSEMQLLPDAQNLFIPLSKYYSGTWNKEIYECSN